MDKIIIIMATGNEYTVEEKQISNLISENGNLKNALVKIRIDSDETIIINPIQISEIKEYHEPKVTAV